QENFTSLVVKDLSATGIRVVATRLVKSGDILDIKMCVNGRDIQCQGKVAWSLLLSPCLGGISPFDVGMEFSQMNQDDKEFLERLVS
ncbi:MAG: PilZ domain-containing protein, partial [Candidatus Omnitrophica bacterium]|nr:PilZ domain-containing protein [Candidatus Omnitrophota bacterium]